MLQSWLILSRFLITNDWPSRKSLDAIWTPHDWHEMVRACAGLSCMTSHGVGICLCHSFSALKSPSYCSGLADLTSRRTLVWPKDEPRFEVVVASNNPAVNTFWVNGKVLHPETRQGGTSCPKNQCGELFRSVMYCGPHRDYILVDGSTHRLIHCDSTFQRKTWQIS